MLAFDRLRLAPRLPAGRGRGDFVPLGAAEDAGDDGG
jgi:hypothetical protein